ncbi:MAG: division plane positioning ATPase MipZ [Planctomycetota bacterium]
MTSTNSAFVKAFARRSRTRSQAVQPRPASDANSTIPKAPSDAASETVLRVDQPVVNEPIDGEIDESTSIEKSTNIDEQAPHEGMAALNQPMVIDQLGSLYQNQAVVQSTHVWVDTVNDRYARADQPNESAPSPHVEIETPVLKQTEQAAPRYDAPGYETSDVDTPDYSEPEQAEPEHAEPEQIAPETITETSESSTIDHATLTETPSIPEEPLEPEVTQPEREIDTVYAGSMQHIHTAYAAAPVDFDVSKLSTPNPLESISGAPESNSATVADPERSLEVASETSQQEETSVSDPSVEQQTLSSAAEQTRASTYAGVEQRVDSAQAQPPKSHTRANPLLPFQPVWEVDVFDIPRVVADLFFDGELFQQIAERMGEAVNTGLNSVLVTSAQPGEGRSSIAIGIAMAAAAAGIRVALVDADTEKPTLAEDLRLDLQYGWVDTIRGGLPISEVAVHAVEDGVTLIPLMQPNGPTAGTAEEVAQLLKALRNRFELVVVDGPAEMSQAVLAFADSVDTAIVVRDTARTDARMINEYSYRLREAGIQGVGIVENFV